MNLYKCLYCEKVYRTFQARNAHQGKCESGFLEVMPENHDEPQVEIKRIFEMKYKNGMKHEVGKWVSVKWKGE